MEYVDPHHKRTDFTADGFKSWSKDDAIFLTFDGSGLHKYVNLYQRGSDVVVSVPEFDCEFTLWKLQLLLSPNWLTLDLKDNPALRRLLIYVDHLSIDALDACLKDLVAGKTVLYYRHP